MLLGEFSEQLNRYLKSDFFQDYGPNGIQVEGKEEVHRIATAVSANLKTIQMAIDKHCDALVVHHGLFWNGDPYPIRGAKKKKIKLLLDNQISLLAYHLPLDAHQEIGNNWKAAQDLGWENLESFKSRKGMDIGVKGRFKSIFIEHFIKTLETYYEHPAHLALGGKEYLENAALISGGAYRELIVVAEAGIDCFITGNFDEPAWAMAYEENIHFLALGHSATERVAPKALAEYLSREMKLDSEFIDVQNPF
ncbi:MAG: Nif3-like dinuclear metal center hexameric protein [Chlamydiales bacterium]